MRKYKDALVEQNLLGKGTYGKVYKISDKFALKQQYEWSFTSFSALFIETSFHLYFPENVPLIPLEDMFIEYDPSKNNPYTLNIIMQLAETDLSHIIQ